MLEPFTVPRAAERITAGEIENLEHIQQNMERATLPGESSCQDASPAPDVEYGLRLLLVGYRVIEVVVRSIPIVLVVQVNQPGAVIAHS